MMRARSLSNLFVVVTILAAAYSASAAQEKVVPTGMRPNVAITLTVGKSGGSGPPEKIFKLIGQDGSEARMVVGWRTPIPSVSAPGEEAGKSLVTSYTYQNVGVSATLTARVLGKGRISLEGVIEISAAHPGQLVDAGGQKLPIIGTFQRSVKVIVVEGKKLRIAEAPDPEGGTVSLDIEAAEIP